jgi:ATP-dependent protease HslVU (ClpYQ) peptidase subunit
MDYMSTTWLDSLRDYMRFKGLLKRENEIESIPDSEAIIAYEDEVFVLQEDLALIQSSDRYAASGSGAALALHALVGRLKDPKAVLRAAIQAAEDHCPSCGGPIHIVRHEAGRKA